MQSLVFEVIQPDLEIKRRHFAALSIGATGRQCASRFGRFCGGIRANSGGGIALSVKDFLDDQLGQRVDVAIKPVSKNYHIINYL
jgi:hypothetical protein